ncbi:tetratricopeptide repeat protein [Phenylobacterium sp.]|jgi:predicted O-linked N-acetylglucosamine transferase (SPINDLY family)|uniref:tetratricopeptide repeat protein n=1 Tax=Phenylobacterium sp. TaxID=1871053 RepID=UPI002E2EE03B|nr:tetratricopeptide repeat protein [Phenylobacterium sp.]HEX2561725.1 tetratricopeptide repeat protein [Phenylobacterium sp.]
MDPRFAEAEAALQAGRYEDGVRLTEAALEGDPMAPAALYRSFTAILFRRQDYARAARWARAGTEQHPKDSDLFNMLGVALRRMGRLKEALEALDAAARLNPKNPAVLQNKGNVLNDLKDGPGAVDVFTRLVRAQPGNAELQRGLGRGYLHSGELAKAEMRYRLAVKLKPDNQDAWMDLLALLTDGYRIAEAVEALDRAVAANPGSARLLEAKAVMLRRAGRRRDADAYLTELAATHPSQAWIHYQIGLTVADYDRERANHHLRRAFELAPHSLDYRLGLAESLNRSRYGDESAHIEEAYQVVKGGLSGPITNPVQLKIASEVLMRVGAHAERDRLGSFAEAGRLWAGAGMHAPLLAQMARVETPEDRHELIAQHRIWGDLVQAQAARTPIPRPGPRAPDGKIRIGFMSSDLRNHPVAYFALPLFEHYDRSRFELYCYSYNQGDEDQIQKFIAESVHAFRWWKDISDRDAAEKIAQDQLDILIELGGSTHMNKLPVMAYKPARRQASWLGYPHSAGPTAIDHIVLDPYLVPKDPALLIETPLTMPKTWLALGRTFRDSHAIAGDLAEERNGFITFGTANNPHKYNERLIRTWARVVREVPGSKFAFIRPEGNAPSFRQHMADYFAAEGVSADRLVFHTVRGVHMPFYNEVDITLDPFPLTGGTSTCEALWMGAPVVNLRGEALFERLSYSILSNVGLAHHSADTLDGYVDIAIKLAADREQRRELRRTLRERIKQSPLGQPDAFARDFYEMIARAVTAEGAEAVAG